MDSLLSNKITEIDVTVNNYKELYSIPEHILIETNENNKNNIEHMNGTFGLYTLPKPLTYFPGAYSVVVVYKDNTTLNSESSSKRIVLKVMKNNKHNIHKIKQELDIYNTIRTSSEYSEYICKCYGIKQQTHNSIVHNYLTLEYMTCDLFDYIFKHNKPYTCSNVYSFLHQIAVALKFLHSFDIVYNDLKLENIMISKVKYNLETKQTTFQIKLIDFNCSTILSSRKTAGGTLEYMSPELQNCIRIHNLIDLTTQSDIWGLGLITCLLFFHNQPYESNDPKKIINKIQTNKLNSRVICEQYIEYQKDKTNIPSYLNVTNDDFNIILDILDNCFKTESTKRMNIDRFINLVVSKMI